jgi:hypothetical protein
MVVQTRAGNEYMFIKGYDGNDVFSRAGGYISINSYDVDLLMSNTLDKGFDIVKVWYPSGHRLGVNKGSIAFKRQKAVEMTIADIERKLGVTGLKVVK